jgi:chromosomal replication initiation ATPase DnaA
MTLHDYTHEILDAIIKIANIDPLVRHKLIRKIHNLQTYRDYKNRAILPKKSNKPYRPVAKIVFHKIPAVIQQVIFLACEKNEVDLEQFCSNRRNRDILEAQRHVIYFLHRETKYTSTKVATWFMKDHSTILHACNTHEDLYETNRLYAMVYDSFKEGALKIISEA